MSASHGESAARREAEARPYDLVIGGGLLVHPEKGTSAAGDIAVRDGRIVAVVEPGGAQGKYAEYLDAHGLLVTPGLIDLHTHVYDGATGLGIAADLAGVRSGVTTVVDAGSSGSDNFDDFRRTVVSPSATRVLSWLNISRHGLTRGSTELAGHDDIRSADTIGTILAGRDVIRGVKIRMSRSVVGENGLEPLRAAKRVTAQVAAETGRPFPVMVHVGNAPPEFGDVLDLLGPGDVVTHAFHGKAGGLFPEAGSGPLPQARDAVERGVRLDVGHGSASFAFDTMERALEHGIRPHTISTDIHRKSLSGPVHGLTTTMTKLLAAGLTLNETVRAVTCEAAESIGLAGEIGSLAEGRVADIALLDRVEDPTPLVDAEGRTRTTGHRLTAVAAVRAGVTHRIRKADA
ncbi:dihydroorotase [Streptomyces sp. 840.1]|uniref:amidohydrolase/deacetylase family metallohydrolase n=1 Tax=Streptomyces sp. 840.1 TaxID=2485152 RepID=UPI000F49CDB5|nr:amidohydrolase/deacetylase family metallohydrolase [Streptomyces sp. 840.1]ROQ60242.1 dihydroorotase [Streptomyces sp. 840.1]